MSNSNKKSVFFYTACIFEFAENYKLSLKEAFEYINRYKGLQYLMENYEIEHTLSKEDTLEALTNITLKNGGNLK